mmetsp:Transcript_10629/g.20557  ORF Transcript_10629/g.20557 Transcript_10629/m.20557 type:complete len:208 (+) Transcript_10629:2442-3065(+)
MWKKSMCSWTALSKKRNTLSKDFRARLRSMNFSLRFVSFTPNFEARDFKLASSVAVLSALQIQTISHFPRYSSATFIPNVVLPMPSSPAIATFQFLASWLCTSLRMSSLPIRVSADEIILVRVPTFVSGDNIQGWRLLKNSNILPFILPFRVSSRSSNRGTSLSLRRIVASFSLIFESFSSIKPSSSGLRESSWPMLNKFRCIAHSR